MLQSIKSFKSLTRLRYSIVCLPVPLVLPFSDMDGFPAYITVQMISQIIPRYIIQRQFVNNTNYF